MAVQTPSGNSLPPGLRGPDPIAGVLCGLIAGAAYLVAQMSFAATLEGASPWTPLQRIAAILLGEQAAPPSDFSMTMVGMALLIHFALAIVFGRFVDWAVGNSPLATGAWRGAAVGGVLYLVNFWALAPLLFPWFEESGRFATPVDHLLFGAIAGACCVLIRRRRAAALLEARESTDSRKEFGQI
jgi:hypothetical protein